MVKSLGKSVGKSLGKSVVQSFEAPRTQLLSSRVDNLADVSIAALAAAGIRGVILDLDNTIVSEDDRYLSPGAEAWIRLLRQAGLRVMVLSNGKRRARAEAWSERLGLPVVSPARKPFPRAFRRAFAALKLTPRQVMVIGDSRHTDVLGAWLVGARSIQVASLPHPPRWWEHLLGRMVQNPYPDRLKHLLEPAWPDPDHQWFERRSQR
jgi:uncharacterized protein